MPPYDAFFFSAFFFLLGVFLASVKLGFSILVITAFLAVLFLILWFFKKQRRFIFVAACVLFVVVGAIYYTRDDRIFNSASIPFGSKISASGIIVNDPVRKSGSQEFLLELDSMSPGKILVRAAPYPEFDYGDRISLKGNIERPSPESYANYLAKERAGGVSAFPTIKLLGEGNGSRIKNALLTIKHSVGDSFRELLPPEEAAFLGGLTLGERNDFTKEFKDAMQVSGTTHLVALSGYNITIIVEVALAIFALFLPRRFSFFFTVLFVLGFVVMTGAEASVVRAAIMGLLILLSKGVGRVYSFRNAITFAGLLMVLVNPKVLAFDVGFQLSFLALLGIVYLRPALIEIFRVKETKSFLSWKENLFTTAAAQLAVIPILVVNFGSFSPISFLANILVLGAVPFTMTLGFLIGVVRLVSYYLALVIGWIAWIFLKFETSVIKLFGTAGTSLHPAMGVWLVVAYYAFLIGLILYLRLPRERESVWKSSVLMVADTFSEFAEKLFAYRKKLITLFAVLVLFDAFLIWRMAAAAAPKNLEMYFLDVGQGDSELVVLPTGAKILIDGGPPNGKVLAALGRVLPPSDRSIDLVVMSHPQLDHFGGLIEVIERYRVGAFISNGLAGTVSAYGDLERTLLARGVREVVLGKGDAIKNTDSVFSVLSPGAQIVKNQNINESALVLKLVSKNAKALFTGDIGAETEAQVRRALNGNIDVLKVAHHGSKYSSSASFLAAARPKVSVIEVGKNSYGHPTPDVLDRLGNIGSKIFRTDKDSTVEAVADGKHIQIFSLP